MSAPASGPRAEEVVDLSGLPNPLALCGPRDANIVALEGAAAVVVRVEGERLRVQGGPAAVAVAARVLARMIDAVRGGATLAVEDVLELARDAAPSGEMRSVPRTILVTPKGKEVRPRGEGQRRLVEAVETHPLTFGIGPAGTGKTFVAMAMAVRALRAHEVSRIVLTRPAVEAGEKLGFLPGDLKEKVDPYLRPLYDALGELLEDGLVAKMLERGTIEVAPIAYMRGRTLADAFVIVDEAQNATREQVKMILTRLGLRSRMVVTGDVTQIDLPRGVPSGLGDVDALFEGVEGIARVRLTEADVVRHPLVARIVAAYAKRA